MLSLLLSLSLSANLLGLKVSTGRSGVSLLLQETNTPLLSCVAHRSCLVILSPFSARLYSFISSLQRVLWSGFFYCCTTCKTSWKWRKKWTRSDLDQWFRWAAHRVQKTNNCLSYRIHLLSLDPHDGILLYVYVQASSCAMCVECIQHLIVTDLINFQADCWDPDSP